MINSGNWGGIEVSAHPKKKSVSFKVDLQGNFVGAPQEVEDESPADRMNRLKAERAKKLGIQ